MESIHKITQDTTLEDLINDPKKYGVPSFMEFCQNPQKLNIDNLAIVDQSSSQLRRIMKGQTYKVLGIECKTLEKAEELAKDLGHDIRTMDFKPEIENLGGQWCNIIVNFVPKQLNILDANQQMVGL